MSEHSPIHLQKLRTAITNRRSVQESCYQEQRQQLATGTFSTRLCSAVAFCLSVGLTYWLSAARAPRIVIGGAIVASWCSAWACWACPRLEDVDRLHRRAKLIEDYTGLDQSIHDQLEGREPRKLSYYEFSTAKAALDSRSEFFC
jgi:hypothetical protein